jgi:hypothetical protein
LPEFGQKYGSLPHFGQDCGGVSDPGEIEDLIGYLARTSRLSPTEARRVVHDMLAFLKETPEQFARRRHRALQAEGLSNPAIYTQLAAELAAWRFCAPSYTERQVRRMIYG